jgi:hypothetical protein
VTEIAPPRHQVGNLEPAPGISSGLAPWHRGGGTGGSCFWLRGSAPPGQAGAWPGGKLPHEDPQRPRVPPAVGGVFFNTHDGGAADASGAANHLADRAWRVGQLAHYCRGTARWASGRAEDNCRCLGAGRTIGTAGRAQPNLLGREGPA